MKKVLLIISTVLLLTVLSGCEDDNDYFNLRSSSKTIDTTKQQQVAKELSYNQSTPTDISFSLERYNLIKRAYWVNGQREKANNVICEVEKPLGYIVLFTESGSVVGNFIVDGKVSSLNSFLTPSNVEHYYSSGATINTELSDVDGSYGENDNGIFFFTPDGKYIEWTGTYLYSDIPFNVENPVLRVGE